MYQPHLCAKALAGNRCFNQTHRAATFVILTLVKLLQLTWHILVPIQATINCDKYCMYYLLQKLSTEYKL